MVRTSAIVLVVEDEKINRRLMQAALESKGYHPRMVESGQAALDYLRDWHVDLVLLDIVMPDMDGFQVLHTIRRNYPRAGLPVIMVTSMSASEDITRALNIGANDYITKPLDIEVMHARIHTQLSLKQARLALEKSIERFDLAVQGTSDGIWDWNLETNEIYYSPRWKSIIGYAPHLIRNTPGEWFERVHGEDRAKVERALEGLMRGRDAKLECEYRIRHKDGSYRWVLTRGTALMRKDGSAYRVVGGQTDITHNKLFDPQTGLYSRSLFEDRLSQALGHCQEQSRAKGVMLLLGLDQFGFVRHSLHELMEDELLMRIGKRLKECIGEEDCLARFGGESFAILLPDVDSEEQLNSAIGKIRACLGTPFSIRDLEVYLHLGVGIVQLDETYADTAAVIHSAYAALEEAKRRGKDKEAIFDAALHRESTELLRLEAEMRNGIDRDEFVLHYQPIVSLKQERVVAVEVLVRWNHPRHGFILPGRFIHIAEQSGLILELGDWVLRRACAQAKRWLDRGYRICVSVNFSAQQFMQKHVVESILDVLERTELPPQYLKVELTESALVDDIERTIDKLYRLRHLGVSISLDDFGTGYSSLSYLKRFPLDIIKIDQSFVRSVTTDDRDAAIIRAILQLAESLHLDIIAEGVETLATLDFLRQIGCDLIQGYYISRPKPVAELDELFSEGQLLPALSA